MLRSTLLFGLSALMGVVSAEAATIEVVVDNLAFAPAEVQAKVGDTIRWRNKDSFVHSATADGVFDVDLPVGRAGTTILRQAGAIEYFCRYHPNMKGRIGVAPR